MTTVHDYLLARMPSLREKRGERELFVWGDVGQWLVVDEDVAFLLDHFAKKRRIGEVLAAYAQARGVAVETIEAESLAVIRALVERGILGSPPQTIPPPTEPLRIANLTFNITNRCNLSCDWCYNQLGQEPEIPIGDLMNWIRRGSEALDDDATFIILGGEPFLDEKRLVECVRRAREQFRSEILVSTNGTKLSSDTARELARASVTVQISLDSADPTRHDAIRSPGVFQRAVTTARQLRDAQVCTVLSMVMTHDSQEEFASYLQLADTIGADEVRFIPLRRIGRGVPHADRAPDLYACFQKLVGLVRDNPAWSRLLRRDFFSILMTVCRYSRLRDNCGIARRCLFVNADGGLFPCPNHRDSQFGCGHVRTANLSALLATSPALQACRDQYRVSQLPVCRECAVRYWCAGDCRAEALSVAGVPTAPSPYCDALQKIIPDMFWLLADNWQGLASHEQDIRPWS